MLKQKSSSFYSKPFKTGPQSIISSYNIVPATDLRNDPEVNALDPADYIFNNEKSHDCYFTLGDPSNTKVKIGVVSIYLISQSTVFREMLQNIGLADNTGANIFITDINEEVFILMLRYMYGGAMPQMSRDTLASLLLCAHKYNVKPLIKWATKRLIPTTVNELFPALRCVAHVSVPDLHTHVTKLLQEQTVEIVKCQQFFQLDDVCMEFITQQKALAITELQLWKSIVCWAKMLAKDVAKQRCLLTRPLKHIRFLTFSQDQITKVVMSTNLLSSEEIVHILSAITNNHNIKLPGFSSDKDKRGIIELTNKSSESDRLLDVSKSLRRNIFYCNYIGFLTETKELLDYKSHSNFTIECFNKPVFLDSFTINTRKRKDLNCPIQYNFTSKIKVGIFDQCKPIKKVTIIESKNMVVSGMGSVDLSLKTNGEPFELSPKTLYNFDIDFDKDHPVFYSCRYNFFRQTWIDKIEETSNNSYFSVKFLTEHHVKEIKYMIKCGK